MRYLKEVQAIMHTYNHSFVFVLGHLSYVDMLSHYFPEYLHFNWQIVKQWYTLLQRFTTFRTMLSFL